MVAAGDVRSARRQSAQKIDIILRSGLTPKMSHRRGCVRERLGFHARVCLSVQPSPFPQRGSIDAVEDGRPLAPKFDPDGLVVCVASDPHSTALPTLPPITPA